jgi:hypothetical protein
MINFVSFGTKNCEELLKFFYNNLLEFCNEDFKLHYFSINYDSKVIGEKLIYHKINYDKKYNNAFFYKPIVLLKSLMDIDCENFVYLDLDILLTKNFSSDTLFSTVNKSKTPLSPNHYWEYPFLFKNNEEIKMGEKVCKLKSIERCNQYVQACLIVYNKNHFEFLVDWISLVNDDSVSNLSVDDEELYNATLWKYNQTKTLGYICVTNGTVNIDNLGCFNSIKLAHEKYELNQFDKSMFTNQNNFYKNFDNKNVMIFHGIK